MAEKLMPKLRKANSLDLNSVDIDVASRKVKHEVKHEVKHGAMLSPAVFKVGVIFIKGLYGRLCGLKPRLSTRRGFS